LIVMLWRLRDALSRTVLTVFAVAFTLSF